MHFLKNRKLKSMQLISFFHYFKYKTNQNITFPRTFIPYFSTSTVLFLSDSFLC